MPARPKSNNQLTNTHKKDSKSISNISSKFVWDSDKKSWKLKWKMSKQVRVVLEKSPLTELKTTVVRLEKSPISEMKTAVVKLNRLAMPKLKEKLLEKNPGTESKQIKVVLETSPTFVWVPTATKLTEKSWKLKWKMSKQVKVVLEKSPLTELKTAVVQLEKCPISEMKTAVVKLKRLAMPKLKGKSLEKNLGTESKQINVVLEKSPLTKLKTAVVQLEKCPISEMKTAVVKLRTLAMPKLKGKLLEKNPGNDCSRKPLLSESERNSIKLMIIENQKASNASKKKLFNKKIKELPDYEKRRLTNIRERKTMFANLKKDSLILSASKSERRKIFSIPKRIPKN